MTNWSFRGLDSGKFIRKRAKRGIRIMANYSSITGKMMSNHVTGGHSAIKYTVDLTAKQSRL